MIIYLYFVSFRYQCEAIMFLALGSKYIWKYEHKSWNFASYYVYYCCRIVQERKKKSILPMANSIYIPL